MPAVQEDVAAPIDEVVLARAVLAAASSVAGVCGISRGRYAVARTFGDGGEVVEGVQFTSSPDGMAIEVHLLITLTPIPALAAAVRQRIVNVLQLHGAAVTTIDVWIDALMLDAPSEVHQ